MNKLKPFVVNKILQKSLDLFYLYDKALTTVKFKSDLTSEETITDDNRDETTTLVREEPFTHRLAVYLELLLRKHKLINLNISVDCEYSNFGYEQKLIKNFDDTRQDKKGCIPDIIVHERFNTKSNNLIVIEAKKAIDSYLINTGNGCHKINDDLWKLKAFAEKYQFAYFVLFGKNSAKFWQVTEDISDQQINKLETEIKSYDPANKIIAVTGR